MVTNKSRKITSKEEAGRCRSAITTELNRDISVANHKRVLQQQKKDNHITLTANCLHCQYLYGSWKSCLLYATAKPIANENKVSFAKNIFFDRCCLR